MNIYIPSNGFATQGPAPAGFHIPIYNEWSGVETIMKGLSLTTGDNWRIYLHLPFAGRRSYSSSDISNQGERGYYWSSSPYGSSYPEYARELYLESSRAMASDFLYRASGFSIRCFKDSFEKPTSSWTVIRGTLGGAGIFWNQTDGIISITSNGTTGYTIMDKNLGATTVYSNGDTLTQANMGNIYQWGNNYGFPSTGTISKTSSTRVDASKYGPSTTDGYYESDTFIKYEGDWSSVRNDNLRGGTDGNVNITTMNELKNDYIGEYKVGIYHNATLGLISLSSDGENWITISDKNLGATTVYNDGDAVSASNCGNYYQWGNNYGFPFTGSITTSSTKVNASNYGPGNYYSSSTYITGAWDADWSSVQNDNLWGYTTGTNAAMQGPCGSGYHVPTMTEWVNVYNIGIAIGAWVAKDGNNYKKYLKLPLNGSRNYYNGNVDGQGTYGNYWSCQNRSTGRAYILYMSASELDVAQTASLCKACSIRPFTNTPIKPDSTWKILYQTS